MNFTIYVLGDVSSFYATLNSVAMIFNSNSFMKGVYLVGGFVALISGIMYMIQKGSGENFVPANGPVGGLFGFGMVVACCSISASVTVQDIYTNNIAKVDHIPLIIAAPAGLFTTAAYSIFDKTNTAFQSVSGSYMGVSQSGFITPLKLLFTLRRGVENVDPYLVASIKQFIIDCVPGSDAFNINDFQNSTDMVGYILSNSRPNGLTNYWDNLNPSGAAMACADAAAKIDNVTTAFPASGKLQRMINAGMKDKNPLGGAYTTSNVDDAINNIVLTKWSAAQSSDQFMRNALFFNSVWGTYNCLDSVQDQRSFNLCMISLTQQNEQFRSDAAASGSFFAKIMMPTMVFLQLLFFGFAPIVIIYGLFKGAGALMMYVKYLGFGIWTSSWLPFSAVVQMYIQNDVADKLSQITEKALTPSNFNAVYYDVLATRLAIASDMLAATPLVSAALLGVTGYGMVSLANRWSGRDHNDEKLQSPDLLKNGPSLDVGARTVVGSQLQGNSVSGLARADATWSKAGIKDTLGTSTQSAMGEDHTKRSESAAATDAALKQAMSYKQGNSWQNSDMHSLAQSYDKNTQQAMKSGEKIADSLSLKGAEKDAFTQAFNANVGLGGIVGGLKAGIQNATGKEASKEQLSQVSRDFGSEISKNESDMKGWRAQASSTFSQTSGSDSSTEHALSRRLSSTKADTQSSFERFQKATSAESSVSASAEISEQTTGGNLTRSPAAMRALNESIGGLNDSQRQEFNKKWPELETRYGQQSKGMVGARETAQLWALKAIGADTEFASVISNMQSGTVNSPTDSNASRNEGVGAQARRVGDDPGAGVSQVSMGTPSLNVPGVGANQVGPAEGNLEGRLKEQVKAVDEWDHAGNRETYVNSQMPTTNSLQFKDNASQGRQKIRDTDTTMSPEDMRDKMSSKPIVNTMTAVGQKEQQWADENPKTAFAVESAAMLVPGLGWGGAVARVGIAGRSMMAANAAREGLIAAEAGTAAVQAAGTAVRAGREIPALLSRPAASTARVVDAEHVAQATQTLKAATSASKAATGEAVKSVKTAAKLSVEPGAMLAANHMANERNDEVAANGIPQQPATAGGILAAMQNHDHPQVAHPASQGPMALPPPEVNPLMAPPSASGGQGPLLAPLSTGPSHSSQGATIGDGLMGESASAPSPFAGNDAQPQARPDIIYLQETEINKGDGQDEPPRPSTRGSGNSGSAKMGQK
ncbi:MULTISPECIES: conjugal transfer protein TraG N-terminal domain-containing protein [Pseudomonas]|uniref:conjugal transfer protein TraG N-terminal domain-containing protein n=1 Tax=Pseudomonas TaxID=286 RepID=UPI00387A9E42